MNPNFKKGGFYKSKNTGTIVVCLGNITINRFKGVVVLSNEYSKIGEYGEGWVKDAFEELKITDSFLNNGWVKIESEKDLPTDPGFYTVGNLTSFGKFSEFQNKFTKDVVRYNYLHNKITHYRRPNLPPNF